MPQLIHKYEWQRNVTLQNGPGEKGDYQTNNYPPLTTCKQLRFEVREPLDLRKKCTLNGKRYARGTQAGSHPWAPGYRGSLGYRGGSEGTEQVLLDARNVNSPVDSKEICGQACFTTTLEVGGIGRIPGIKPEGGKASMKKDKKTRTRISTPPQPWVFGWVSDHHPNDDSLFITLFQPQFFLWQ